MRKFIYTFIIIVAVGVFTTQAGKLQANIRYLFQSPCERPVEYTIGTIDAQFNVTQKEFEQAILDAAHIWNQAQNKQIIQYNPNARLSINLVYDERQMSLDRIGELKGKLDEGKSTFEQQKQQYENLEADFQTRLREFDDQVSYWNSRGGAPQQTYRQLLNEQQDLKNEADQLNILAGELNLAARSYNIQVGQLNDSVEDYNLNLQNKPEEGIFTADGTRIDIYVNNSREELVHTLAHELGHALGLPHVSTNPDAIMYPYSSSVITVSPEDKAALNEVCLHGSFYEIAKTRLADFWQSLRSSFSLSFAR